MGIWVSICFRGREVRVRQCRVLTVLYGKFGVKIVRKIKYLVDDVVKEKEKVELK